MGGLLSQLVFRMAPHLTPEVDVKEEPHLKAKGAYLFSFLGCGIGDNL